jgi:hypothetical protein
MTDNRNNPPAGQPDKANGTAMVVIGCKLPNGLICEMGKYGDDNYERVVLNGANTANIVGGFGFTSVSKSFWDAWVKKHQRMEFVKKGLVFQHNDEASARSHAKDLSGLRTGLERLDASKALPGTTDRNTGKPLVEVDTVHLQTGRRALADMGVAPR